METMTLTKEERIKREKNKLTKQFKGLDDRRRRVAEKSIENAAWMSVTLEDLRMTIDANGVEGLVIEYQNGQNQKGSKSSPEVDVYNRTLANYMKIIKQLSDMLPEEVKVSKDDPALKAIADFIKK